MRRTLNFSGEETSLPVSLGVTPERCQEIANIVNRLIAEGSSLRGIIEYLNTQEDLNDAEWTSVIFALGRTQAETQNG